jgi:uncharacterized Zn-finger protein
MSTSDPPVKMREPHRVLLAACDLPAFCPNPAMPVWNHHPRVFLDVASTGEAMCPYCGTVYRLRPGEHVHGH